MNPERFRQIDELFDAVLDVPDGEREAFLSARTAGDEELKREVLSLLRAQHRSDDYLDRSAMRVAAARLSDEAPAAAPAFRAGQSFGTYRIERQIGAGGMGEVYLAEDTKLRRKVALKILPAEYTSHDERVARFKLEARAVSALNHPNIVTIHDVGSHAGVNYIATEYVEGRTLRELVGQRPRVREVLGLVIQACEALSAAHAARIIHRDIKPENIIVRPDGYVKILDFGLAKLSELDLHTLRDFSRTAKGVIIGTPAYMSPEQVADENVDHRTDLWSIGVVLYELLTGVNPFKKGNRQATFQAILAEEPPPASSFNPDIGAELDQILVKALEKDADLSYQTASDLRADLRRIKRELDSSPSWSQRSGEAAPKEKAPARAFGRRWALLVAAVAVAALGFGVWRAYFRGETAAGGQAPEWINAQHRPLTNWPSVEGYPSISADGKNVVFASDLNNDRNIYLLRIGGKNPVNLTPNSKASDTMPAFSPDGKYIAFRSEREPSGIYVMEETGENARRVADAGFHPSWSPDNRKIVVSDKAAAIHTVHTAPSSALSVIDVATGTRTPLAAGADAIMPSWSPNGHRIAFWLVEGGKLPAIATVPAAGGEPVVVAEHEAADWNPVWSPDGRYLYFASDRGGSMNLWRVAVDEETGRQTGEPEAVTTPSKYSRHIAFARDGKTIAYVRYESLSNLQAIDFDPQTLKTTGEVRWVTRGDKEIGNPALSPAGDAYVARQPTLTQEDLVVFDAEGQNWRNLTNDKYRERLPRWSPDGRAIYFHADRSGRYQIWRVAADGTDAQQLTRTEKSGAVAAVVAPDGSRLAFTELDGGAQSSSLLDLTKPWTAQTPERLPPFPGGQPFSVRDWSADGKKLLYIYFEPDGDEAGTGVYDLEKQTYERMTATGSNPFWLKDNRHFIYTDRNAVYLCDTQTKKATELYKTGAYEIQHANLSADNRQIFWRYLQVHADVWLIEAAGQN